MSRDSCLSGNVSFGGGTFITEYVVELQKSVQGVRTFVHTRHRAQMGSRDVGIDSAAIHSCDLLLLCVFCARRSLLLMLFGRYFS